MAGSVFDFMKLWTAAITQRLNEMELEMDRIAAESAGPNRSVEIWNKREVDE
jgi:hypothetical protein